MSHHEAIVSPRLTALTQQLEAGNTSALEAFWQEIATHGSPLVEPLADDPAHVLVTVLWRATDPVGNVVVAGGPGGWEVAPNRMSLLPGSDLWHKTYRVPANTRATYRVSPGDSLVPWEEVTDWQARTATFQADPLNPRLFEIPRDEADPESRDHQASILELPGAPPQPWVAARPHVPAGQVDRHRVRSAILDNEREVFVYTPPGYATTAAPAGLLLLFDGRAYTQEVPTPTILDNLLADGRIPPLVAVLVRNPDQATRNRELPCHPPFAAFLADELLPWVRGHYQMTTDPRRSVVGGSSFGGLAATFVGLRHPEVFGNVLSQSGSFWWRPEGDEEHEWLTRQFVTSPRLPLRFYLDVGRFETGDTPGKGPNQVVANRHMRDVLLAKGYDLHYTEYSGGHDYLCWRGTLADGLLTLIGTNWPFADVTSRATGP